MDYTLHIKDQMELAATPNMFILTTLSQSGSTTQQGVVVSINVNTIATFVAQQERKRRAVRQLARTGATRIFKCSCSLALERIAIDIPDQPVSLHDMLTRSTKRITNTIQELNVPACRQVQVGFTFHLIVLLFIRV